MSKKSPNMPISSTRYMEALGENIKLARLRRRLTQRLVCERAFISRATLNKVEKGDPTVAMGIYACVLHALNGLDKDLEKVAREDEWGRTIQDLNLKVARRGKERK